MSETIQLIEYILVIIADIALYIGLVCAVYPWFTMRVVLKKDRAPALRGIRRVVFPSGRGVIYLPDLETRRYIGEFAVFENDRRRFIQCRIDPRISVIRYDIASFDRRGRLLDIQSVSERITQSGLTSTVALPTKTAFAQVFVRRVDTMKIRSVAPFGYSKVGIASFFTLTVLTTVAAGLVFFEAALMICELLFSSVPDIGSTTVLFLSLICGVATAGLTLLCYHSHLIRRINR